MFNNVYQGWRSVTPLFSYAFSTKVKHFDSVLPEKPYIYYTTLCTHIDNVPESSPKKIRIYANYKIFFCDFREPSKIWLAEFKMIPVNKIVYMTIWAIIPDAWYLNDVSHFSIGSDLELGTDWMLPDCKVYSVGGTYIISISLIVDFRNTEILLASWFLHGTSGCICIDYLISQ